MALSPEEQKILVRSKELGKSPQDALQAIENFRNGVKVQPSLAQDIASDFSSRVDKASDSIVSDQNSVSKVLQTVGQGAGFVGDIAMRAIERVPGVKPAMQKIGEVIASNEAAQDVASSYATWKAAHPEAAANLESIGNIASILPAGKVAGAATKATQRVLDASADTLSDATKVATKSASGLMPDVSPSAIMQRIGRIPPTKQAEFQKMTGSSVGDYLVQRGAVGTSDEVVSALYKDFTQSVKSVDNALAEAGDTPFKSVAVGSALNDVVTKLQSLSRPGAKHPELETAVSLQKKMQGGGLSLSEINEAKRLYERNVKLDYIKENLAPKVAEANNLDNAIRTFLFDKAEELGVQGLREQNKITQASRFLMDEIGKYSEGRAANNAVSLTDWLVLGEVAAEPSALALYLGKKALSSETLLSKFAKWRAGASKTTNPIKNADPKKGIGDFLEEQDFFRQLDASVRSTPQPLPRQTVPKSKASPKPTSNKPQVNPSPSIPKELEPLAAEARKFKSAEEFVNNKINVFHATNEAQARSIEKIGYKPSLGRGFSNQPGHFAYFTPSVDGAIRYSKISANGLNKITSGHLKGKILEIEGNMPDFEAFGKAQEKLGVPLLPNDRGQLTMLDIEGLKAAMKKQGYSAIQFKDRYANGERAVAAIPEDVVTKSQLTDLWRKANSK